VFRYSRHHTSVWPSNADTAFFRRLSFVAISKSRLLIGFERCAPLRGHTRFLEIREARESSKLIRTKERHILVREMSKDIAATKATGGGGYTFADKVAAGFLALMLKRR